MKAYMIVDFDNPVSMRYSEVAIDSFQPAIQRGLISEIIPTQCIKRDSLSTVKNDYNFRVSKATIDGSDGNQKEMSGSEIAGMCSHWELMRRQRYEDRFFIMEHDAYLLDVDNFEISYNLMLEHDLCYANLGLYMSCYSYNKRTAQWLYNELIHNQFPINSGPYITVERLLKTFITHYLKKRPEYKLNKYSFLQTFRNHEISTLGKSPQDLFDITNFTNVERNNDRFRDIYRTPSTQCWHPEWGVTQEHINYRKQHTLHYFFKRLDEEI